MATFHYYMPWSFAAESKGTWGTADDIQYCETAFQMVQDWSEGRGVPVLLGEFGVKKGTDRASLLKWYETMSNKAIEHGFAFTVWDDGGMCGVYYRSARTWDRELIKRILPAGEDN